jgi:hypothetical protein
MAVAEDAPSSSVTVGRAEVHGATARACINLRLYHEYLGLRLIRHHPTLHLNPSA